MKNTTEYTYTFATGETVTLGKEQISEEWIHILEEMDRVEYNNDQTETRRHCSLEARDPNGKVLISQTDGFEEFELEMRWEAMRCYLTKREQSIARSFFIHGMEVKEVADAFRLSIRRTQEIIATARKKLARIDVE